MSLSSNQIDAFMAVAQAGSFSKAAQALNLTQSALSQRVLNLEDELGVTLVLREPSGLRLTDIGQDLLRYGQKKRALEEEFQSHIGRPKQKTAFDLAGRIRLASFSSVMPSVLFPALSPLLNSHPLLMIETTTREVRDLEPLLRQGAVDFVVTNEEWTRDGLKGYLLGHEENILVQPRESAREEIFLDHDPSDRTTEDFWRLNGRSSQTFQRSYLDDVHGILEGVALGWGSAIIPNHLLRDKKTAARVKVARRLKPLKTPVWLYHYDQPYYSQLELAVIKAITEGTPTYLG